MPLLLPRRCFLRAAAGAGLLVACGGGGRRPPRDAGDGAPLTATPAVADDDELPPAAPAGCVPTADNIEGPYFKPGAPEQLYFAGDPYNDDDPFIVDSLVMAPREHGGGLACRFDLVLAPA